jgi:two-component sensor histidine kinase
VEQDDLTRVLRQQAALAEFGGFAFDEPDLRKVLTEAARLCAQLLSVPYCKVSRYDQASDTFMIVAGVGWNEGVVGYYELGVDTPARQALTTNMPVVITDLAPQTDDPNFGLYASHGIISCVNVLIKGVGSNPPFGVLEVDSPTRHEYNLHDIGFLTGFANVLAERVSTTDTIQMLRRAIKDKDELLREQDRLLSELHHRVRNNLQLVIGMLGDLPIDTEMVSQRVFSLAQVYDHLIESSTPQHQIDFGSYLRALCTNLLPLFNEHAVELIWSTSTVFVGLDIASALALAANEMLLVRLDRAIQNSTVTINMTLEEDTTVRLTITDFDPAKPIDLSNKRSGLGLVSRLAQQLGATLDIVNRDSLVTTLIFSLIREK